jgi:hypothetical protein
VRVGSVIGMGRVIVDRAVCDRALALVGFFRRMGEWDKKESRRRSKRNKVERKEKKRTLQLRQRLLTRQLVAFADHMRVHAHYNEVFCLFEELAGKDHDRFRTVIDLSEDGEISGVLRERGR